MFIGGCFRFEKVLLRQLESLILDQKVVLKVFFWIKAK